MLKLEGTCRLLTAVSKPYDFNGNVGTSHKVRVNLEGEIFELKSTENQVNKLKGLVEQDGTCVVGISSPKERLTAELVEFSQ